MKNNYKLCSFNLKKIAKQFEFLFDLYNPKAKISISKKFKDELQLFSHITKKNSFKLSKNTKLKLNDLKINFKNKKFIEKWKKNLEIKLIETLNQSFQSKDNKKIKKYYFNFLLKNNKKWFFWSFPDYCNFFKHESKTKEYKNLLKYFHYFLKHELIQQFLKKIISKLIDQNDKTQQFFIEHYFKEEDFLNEFGSLQNITQSNKLTTLLPSEIVFLKRNNLKVIFLKKYIDNELYNYLHKINTFVIDKRISDTKKNEIANFNKKLLIICVDSSNSMREIKEIIAKIISFGLVYEMQNYKNYKIHIIKFSNLIKSYAFIQKIDDLKQLDNFLKFSFKGQTFIQKTFEFIIENFLKIKNQNTLYDVMFISDFIVGNFSNLLKEKIKFYQKFNTKFFAIVLGNNYNQKILKNFNYCFYY